MLSLHHQLKTKTKTFKKHTDMKKFILFAAILFAGVSVVSAKKDDPKVSGSTSTELSVKLMPIQTITINQNTVELLYKTEANYNDGVTLDQSNHFKVYSTGGFSVGVSSSDDKLKGDKGKDIDAKTITVEASSGTNSSDLKLSDVKPVPLSKKGSTLFASDKGGADLHFNVKYVGGTLKDYFDKLFNGSDASVFETTVTYSITPN